MGDVVKLNLVEVGENFRFDAGQILDGARERKFNRFALIGELEDGTMYVAGTANAGESLVLLERAKRHIVFGDDP